jgi:ketosteroid isomerase-like protein
VSRRSENVRVAERTYAAFAEGDLPGVLENFHDDVEWHAAEGLPWGGVHNGRDAVAQNVFGALMTNFDGFTVNVERFIDDGDDVVAIGRYSATGKASGKQLDAAFAHCWEFEGGKLKRFQHHTDTVKFQQALA